MTTNPPAPGDELLERLDQFIDSIPEQAIRAAYDHFLHYAEHPCSASALRSAFAVMLRSEYLKAPLESLRTRDEAARSATSEVALLDAIEACAKIEMEREGYPLSRSQEEIYDDAAEMVGAIIEALQAKDRSNAG